MQTMVLHFYILPEKKSLDYLQTAAAAASCITSSATLEYDTNFNINNLNLKRLELFDDSDQPLARPSDQR